MAGAVMNLQKMVVNYEKVRREVVQGREYLVAPATLIVPGVLNGSHGPLYYPPEEIAKSVFAWNHMPVVVNHPYSEDGVPISARTPQVVMSTKIGEVYNSYIGANGELRAETWIDVELADRVDKRVVNSLLSGTKLELSTGVVTMDEEAPAGSVDGRGREYQYTAREYRPDHLAILPDGVGACSIKDGCGVLVNETSKVSEIREGHGGVVMSGKQGDNASPPGELTIGGVLVWQPSGGEAPITVNVDLSFTEIEHELCELVMEQFPPYSVFGEPQECAYIMAVYPGYFIYRKGDELYKQTYEISNGEVTVTTWDMKEVEKVVEYVEMSDDGDE